MTIVKILQGAYGSRDGKGRVHPIFKGERVEVSDQEALRLVKLGVAEIVGPASPAVAPQTAPDPERMPQDTADGGKPVEAPTIPVDEPSDSMSVAALERMTKADLEQMAQDMGVDLSGAKNNRERAELIAAAEAEEGGEVLPELGAGDIVQ
ncbi:hypothetical protein [uncultured Oscillibacter sp.]|uniref:hypothetical protein n=1 Tax=uncultured Oscillibacter sp. TaxID=876091 RepID=UPI00261A25A3|nr:hypothetical protein [uncultured Oscillibacter sp.]